MDLARLSERLMGMDAATWRRHANPWSVFSRMATLPLLALAVFSRAWIGWWALLPVAATLAFVVLNPRLFAAPSAGRAAGGLAASWAAKGVHGERIWLRRHDRALPPGHLRAGRLLIAASALGLVPFVYGLVALDAWATAFGGTLTMGAKLWYFDRMVWLCDRVEEAGGPVS
jgi:hypothetical protein